MIVKGSRNSKIAWIAFGLLTLGLCARLLIRVWSPTPGEAKPLVTHPGVSAEPAQASPAPSAPPLTSTDSTALSQLRILEEILASRNDNDPRLDRELRVLSPAAKALLRAKYGAIPAEKRNDRGTIVYLLGRNLTSAADFRFLQEVVREAPCLSLLDCAKNAGPSSGTDEHSAMGMSITLAYPQIVALQSIHAYSGDAFKKEASEVLSAGLHSSIPVVSQMAQKLTQ
jgi:hypothetical protein